MFINQNFYAGINVIVDAGMVLEDIPFDKSEATAAATINYPEFDANRYFGSKEVLHVGYGSGGRLVMNQKFVIALDAAQSARKEDGGLGIYIGLNYLF